MSDEATPRSRERRYRVLGLAERDELVVRSMIKLLAGKTRDRWLAVDADPVHLLIVPVEFSGALPVGTSALRVTVPLRADDLWSQLDRASAQLDLDDDLLRPSRRGGGDARGAAGGRRLQLLRWPPDTLLGADLRYLRLATMLGARPFSIEELAAKANLPLATCHAFAAVLHANGVAQWLLDPEDPDAPVPEAAPSGLVSRIRSRLGLQRG